MQQADFPIEIVIADDCSTDGTIALAKTYRSRFPNLIRILERSKNVGTQRNYYDAFEQCRGKYIAWLDADDYWTDPAKLAIQVEALEADPSLMICCHFVRWVIRDKDGEVTRERFPTLPAGRHGMESILRSNFLPSPSVVFRNGLHRQLPQWYFDVPPLTDWPLYVVAARSGDILLIDRVMADYTLNATSAFWGERRSLLAEDERRVLQQGRKHHPRRVSSRGTGRKRQTLRGDCLYVAQERGLRRIAQSCGRGLSFTGGKRQFEE